MINIIHNKNIILEKMIQNQLSDIDIKIKLNLSDIKRFCDYIEIDIFSDDCCLWRGPTVNTNNKEYISFYLNKKKISLNRILYQNYVEKLEPTEYLKFTCCNKSVCCSIKHMYKINKDKNHNTPDSIQIFESIPNKSISVSFN